MTANTSGWLERGNSAIPRSGFSRPSEWSFGSNRWVKVGRGQFWSIQSPSWTQLRFLTATECSHAHDRNFSKNFGRQRVNPPIVSKLISKLSWLMIVMVPSCFVMRLAFLILIIRYYEYISKKDGQVEPRNCGCSSQLSQSVTLLF